jgi:hypothetical protein
MSLSDLTMPGTEIALDLAVVQFVPVFRRNYPIHIYIMRLFSRVRTGEMKNSWKINFSAVPQGERSYSKWKGAARVQFKPEMAVLLRSCHFLPQRRRDRGVPDF